MTIIEGTVIHGAGRGRTLGFPTANLDTPAAVLPETGVYAVWVRLDNDERWRRGAASVGYNITFGDEGPHVEVNILDFDEWIYGRRLEVIFAERLRGEINFSGKEELISQMEKDCLHSREILTDDTRPE